MKEPSKFDEAREQLRILSAPYKISESYKLYGDESIKKKSERKGKFINRLFFHFPQPLWKNYRQELMLDVISRIWACSVSSPFFKDASILLIECITVV